VSAFSRAFEKAFYARGRNTWGAGFGPPAVARTALTPLNNQYAVLGDLRTSIGTTDSSSVYPSNLTAGGWLSWLQHGSNYRGKLIGNYGVNGAGLADIQRRLTSVETRGQILSSPAGTFVILAGLDDNTTPIATDGPILDDIINRIVNAGKMILLLNELPNSDRGPGQGVFQRGRRDYINAAAYSATFVSKFDSYTLMAVAPSAASDTFKAGYITAGQTILPNIVGSRALGLAAGAALETLMINGGFPARNTTLSTGAADPNFIRSPDMSGTGGSNSGAANASGAVANAWTADPPPAGITVVYSKTTDSNGYPQQTIVISGTTTAAAGTSTGFYFNCYALGFANYAQSGDWIEMSARVIIEAGNMCPRSWLRDQCLGERLLMEKSLDSLCCLGLDGLHP
jgi:hypothetical protein